MWLSTLAKKTASRLAIYGTIPKEDISLYAYGFELMFSVAINILGMLFLAVIVGQYLSWFWFLLALIPLRLSAGGFHATTHFRCIALTLVVFLLCLLGIQTIPNELWRPIYIVTIISLNISTWCLAPVQTQNKPLSEQEIQINRKRAIIISIIDTLIGIYACTANTPATSAYFMGVLAATISLVAGKIRNIRQNTMEDERDEKNS